MHFASLFPDIVDILCTKVQRSLLMIIQNVNFDTRSLIIFPSPKLLCKRLVNFILGDLTHHARKHGQLFIHKRQCREFSKSTFLRKMWPSVLRSRFIELPWTGNACIGHVRYIPAPLCDQNSSNLNAHLYPGYTRAVCIRIPDVIKVIWMSG